MTNKTTLCELCGESMPEGEEMFKYHGYSGPCPKPPMNEEGIKMKVFLAAVFVLSLGVSSASAQAFSNPTLHQRGTNGLTLFVATTPATRPNSNKMLFVVPSGGSPRELTLGMQARLSTDGKFVVFTKQIDSPYHRQLWRINTDGTGLRQLTFLTDDPTHQDANAASISPDGSMIAFFGGKEESMVNPQSQSLFTYGDRNVWVMPVDGSWRRRLTNCKPVYTQAQLRASTGCIVADNPNWTPDGKTIFFQTVHKTGDQQVWAINPDGSNFRRRY